MGLLTEASASAIADGAWGKRPIPYFRTLNGLYAARRVPLHVTLARIDGIDEADVEDASRIHVVIPGKHIQIQSLGSANYSHIVSGSDAEARRQKTAQDLGYLLRNHQPPVKITIG